MSTVLTFVSDGSTLPAALAPDLAAAIDLSKAEKAASTRKAYGTDFRMFKAWCDGRPAKALREWLDAAGIEAGPILRPIDKAGTVRASRLTCRSVANIVKAYAERAGFDANTFSGQSLRAGFLTSAAGKGASIFKMMDVSRHKSVDTLRGYVRDAELFKDHAGAGLL